MTKNGLRNSSLWGERKPSQPVLELSSCAGIPFPVLASGKLLCSAYSPQAHTQLSLFQTPQERGWGTSAAAWTGVCIATSTTWACVHWPGELMHYKWILCTLSPFSLWVHNHCPTWACYTCCLLIHDLFLGYPLSALKPWPSQQGHWIMHPCTSSPSQKCTYDFRHTIANITQKYFHDKTKQNDKLVKW